MHRVLMIGAVAVGLVAIAGLAVWGLASLILLGLSAVFLWLAWQFRPRLTRPTRDRHP
jgi:membrane protein implicated in regulation of membrane protease activity